MCASPARSPRKHLPHVAANCLPLHMLPAVYLPAGISGAVLYLYLLDTNVFDGWRSVTDTQTLLCSRANKVFPQSRCVCHNFLSNFLADCLICNKCRLCPCRLTAPTDAGDLRDLTAAEVAASASATAFYQSAPVIVIDFTLVFFLRGSVLCFIKCASSGSPAR